MEKLIILTGPTGVGKTKISLEIARKFNCQIISADSMQIYKGLDIGTDKIVSEDNNIKHYMIDIIEADENFSVADFQLRAKKIISQLNKKNIIPLVVGGTGLYINSLVYNLDFSTTSNDPKLREKLNKEAEIHGTQYLYDKLLKLDKETALLIDSNNRNRIIRAIEIIFNGGKKDNNFRSENNEYDLIFLGLNMDRQKLYKKIDNRVDVMLEKGLVNEVEKLLDSGLSEESQSLKAIGYKEVISYLKGDISYNQMAEDIKKNSRHYAKRQLTWFRRDERIRWFNREDEDILNQIFKFVGDRIE